MPLTPKEKVRNVHFSEDVIHHRPIPAGGKIDAICTPVRWTQRPKGCTLTMRFVLQDSETTEPYCTQFTTGYYTGCTLGGSAFEGDLASLPPPLPKRTSALSKASPNRAAPIFTATIPVGPADAHIYTECSRIWNPIHTDRSVALAAGLPDLILHGTATAAKAVTALTERFCAGDAARVQRVAVGAFKANVLVPSTLTLRVFAVERSGLTSTAFWDILTGAGELAIQGGVFVFRNSTSRL